MSSMLWNWVSTDRILPPCLVLVISERVCFPAWKTETCSSFTCDFVFLLLFFFLFFKKIYFCSFIFLHVPIWENLWTPGVLHAQMVQYGSSSYSQTMLLLVRLFYSFLTNFNYENKSDNWCTKYAGLYSYEHCNCFLSSFKKSLRSCLFSHEQEWLSRASSW